MSEKSKTPNLDKIEKNAEDIQLIKDFLKYVYNEHYTTLKRGSIPLSDRQQENRIYQFFGVDVDKLRHEEAVKKGTAK